MLQLQGKVSVPTRPLRPATGLLLGANQKEETFAIFGSEKDVIVGLPGLLFALQVRNPLLPRIQMSIELRQLALTQKLSNFLETFCNQDG